MALLRALWENGFEDECANVVARLNDWSVERAYYTLSFAFD